MNEPSKLEFPPPVVVSDELMLLQIQDLRRRAWSANGEVPDFIARQDILRDEHDVHGMHFAILHEDRTIAAARLCIHNSVATSPDPEALDGYEELIEGPIASLTRLVVDPEFRGHRLSTAMDKVRLEIAQARSCRSILGIGELEYRMKGLEHMGFVRLGPTKIRYLSYAPSYVLLKKLAF